MGLQAPRTRSQPWPSCSQKEAGVSVEHASWEYKTENSDFFFFEGDYQKSNSWPCAVMETLGLRAVPNPKAENVQI